MNFRKTAIHSKTTTAANRLNSLMTIDAPEMRPASTACRALNFLTKMPGSDPRIYAVVAAAPCVASRKLATESSEYAIVAAHTR